MWDPKKNYEQLIIDTPTHGGSTIMSAFEYYHKQTDELLQQNILICMYAICIWCGRSSQDPDILFNGERFTRMLRNARFLQLTFHPGVYLI